MAAPTAPQPGIGDALYIEELARRGQQSMVVSGETQTADILRYTETTPADPTAAIPAVVALVGGLTWLQVAVSELEAYGIEIRDDNGVLLPDAGLVFDFLDLPAGGGIAAGVVALSDVISFRGKLYRPVSGSRRIGNDLTTGRSRVAAQTMGF